MRIKSKTVGNFDYAVDAAEILENVFGKVSGFGLCWHRSACRLIMTSKFATERDGPVVGCETPKPLVGGLLQKNPIANRCEYLRHNPGSQERKRRTKNYPTAGVDVLVGVFVDFCNMQFMAFQVEEPPFAGHQWDLIIRLMCLDKAFNMRKIIPIVSIEIGNRIKTIGISENAANGTRRITHIRNRLWQDYVHCFRLFTELRSWMPVGN